MQDIRCKSCNKLLLKAVFTKLEAKCNRCKTINYLSVKNTLSEDHEFLTIGENPRGKTQTRPQSPR